MSRPVSTGSVQTHVLDASAIIAFLRDEPGAAMVRQALDGHAVVGAVNLAEVLTKMLDKGVSVEMAESAVAVLNVDVISLDAFGARDTARLRTATRHLGLSLGDRACLALAASFNAIVLTADRSWLTLGTTLDLDIRSIRPDAH